MESEKQAVEQAMEDSIVAGVEKENILPDSAESAKEESTNGDNNPLQRREEYFITADVVNVGVKKELQGQAKKVNLKGFRPGKVPVNVMQRMYGKQALNDVLIAAASEQFQKKLEQSGEKPAAYPHFHPHPENIEGQYKVICEYEIMPDVSPPDFSGTKIVIPTLPVGENEVEEMIENLREKRGQLVVHDGKIEEDSFVVIDFKTSLRDGGDVIEEGQDKLYRMNTPGMLEQVKSQLLGGEKGKELSADFVLPDTHENEELRGKDARVDISVKDIKRLEKPALDETFFSEFGVGEGGLDAFKEMVEEHLRREVDVRLSTLLKNRVMDKLIEVTPPFPIPNVMVASEAKALENQYQQRIQSQGGKPHQFSPDEMRTLIFRARRMVLLGLIISAWHNRSPFDVEDKEITERLDRLAEAYEDPESMKKQFFSDSRLKNEIKLSIIEDKVVDWIKTNVESEEEVMNLSALMA